MLLYPIDTALAWWVTVRELDRQRDVEIVIPSGSGVQMDLRHMAIHCGPIGWAGAWSWVLGILWMICGSALCLVRSRGGRRVEAQTSRSLVAVLSGILIVLAAVGLEGVLVR
jgi:hypothetical protein